MVLLILLVFVGYRWVNTSRWNNNMSSFRENIWSLRSPESLHSLIAWQFFRYASTITSLPFCSSFIIFISRHQNILWMILSFIFSVGNCTKFFHVHRQYLRPTNWLLWVVYIILTSLICIVIAYNFIPKKLNKDCHFLIFEQNLTVNSLLGNYVEQDKVSQ